MSQIRFSCPYCRQKLLVGPRRAGKEVACPKCQRQIRVPDQPVDEPGPDESSDTRTTTATQSAATSAAPVDGMAADLALADLGFGGPASPVPAHEPAPPPPAPVAQVAPEPPETVSPTIAAPEPQAPIPEPRAPEPELQTPDPNSFAAAPSFPEYSVVDETEWVYEDESQPQERIDPAKIAVSRRILYAQGALLGAVAIICFVLGMLFGRTLTPAVQVAAAPTPCRLHGKIEYTAGGLASSPDAGSIVIIVPELAKPDPRVRQQLEGLATATSDMDPAVAVLRELGGDFAVAQDSGQFQLRLPDRGAYYLLVMSANVPRPAAEAYDRSDLAQIGSFFGPATRLVGDRRYQWSLKQVGGDQELNVLF